MRKKNTFVRVICWVLAAVMIIGVAATVIAFLANGD